jgi:hypothetical protein
MPNKKANTVEIIPMLKTPEQLSKISGIGENKIRQLMTSGELKHVKIGNRRLATEHDIEVWYRQNQIPSAVPEVV